MAQVVQACCPGCKESLRIPADWLNRTMRCKHCGLMFQARARGAEPAAATVAQSGDLGSAIAARSSPHQRIDDPRLTDVFRSAAVANRPQMGRVVTGQGSRTGSGLFAPSWKTGILVGAGVLLMAGVIAWVGWSSLSQVAMNIDNTQAAEKKPKKEPLIIAEVPRPVSFPDVPRKPAEFMPPEKPPFFVEPPTPSAEPVIPSRSEPQPKPPPEPLLPSRPDFSDGPPKLPLAPETPVEKQPPDKPPQRKPPEKPVEATPKLSAEGEPAVNNTPSVPAAERLPKVVEEAPANPALVRGILEELAVPIMRVEENTAKSEGMPKFTATQMAAYVEPAEKSLLSEAVEKARMTLKNHVAELQKNPQPLPTEYTDNANENQFKGNLEARGKRAAQYIAQLTEAVDDLLKAGELRDRETSKRTQANYDYTLARLKAQLAYLYEYNSMLGQLRREKPPLDKDQGHNGWKLVAKKNPQGDKAGKDLIKEYRKLLDKIAKDHPGTPWEVIAKRDASEEMGLEWQSARVGQRQQPRRPGKKK